MKSVILILIFFLGNNFITPKLNAKEKAIDLGAYVGLYGEGDKYSVTKKEGVLYYSNQLSPLKLILKHEINDEFKILLPPYLRSDDDTQELPDIAFSRDNKGEIISMSFIQNGKQLQMAMKNKTIVNVAKKETNSQLIEAEKILEKILITDQEVRKKYIDAESKHGRDSKVAKFVLEEMKNLDAINTDKVSKILDKHGWLGDQDISDQASLGLFLVIQHAKSSVQLKYLPMMKKAAKVGKLKYALLVTLEDRVSLFSNKEDQLYGTQMFQDDGANKLTIAPLKNPDRVDIIRKKVGLPPLKEYLKNFDLEWDIEAYKKSLPELRKRFYAKIDKQK